MRLGTFEVNGPLFVTDPCYDRPIDWGQVTVENPLAGQWSANVLSLGESRVSCLVVAHSSVEDLTDFDTFGSWVPMDNEISVDSGQVGIFLKSKFPTDVDQFEYEDDTFYSRCCQGTNPASMVTEGVVSRTAYGDGTYPCFTVQKHGKVVAILVDFVGVTEEEEN